MPFCLIYSLFTPLTNLQSQKLKPNIVHQPPTPTPNYTTMTHSCAALHHCAMKGITIDSIVHRCMNCTKPMHGALCGALFAERGEGIQICPDVMSEHGQNLYHSHSAVICAMCISTLNGAKRKSPASIIVDIDQDQEKEDGDYRPPQAEEDEGAEGDPTPSDLSEDDIEVIELRSSRAVSSAASSATAATSTTATYSTKATSKKTRPPRKRKDPELYRHFVISQLVGGGVSVSCTHCNRFNKPYLQQLSHLTYTLFSIKLSKITHTF